MRAISKLAVLLGWLALAVAKDDVNCRTSDPNRYVPGCTDPCLEDKALQGTCADDLAGFCNRQDGVELFFHTFTSCIISQCPDDSDITQFLVFFRDRCVGTKYGPLTKIPGELDDWFAPLRSGTSTSKAASATAASSSATSPQTLTGAPASSAPASQPAGPSSPSPSTAQPSKPSQAPPNAPSATANGQPAPAPAPGPSDGSHRTTFRTPGPIAPTTTLAVSEVKDSSMSKGQIVGSAAGGTAVLAALAGAVFFFMRRRRRRNAQPSRPNMWDPDRNTDPKTETPNGAVFEKHSERSTTSPAGPAELHNHSSPTSTERPMNERYPNLTKSLSPSNSTAARYYSATTQSELDAISPNRTSDMHPVSPTTPRSPASEVSAMNAWHVPSTSAHPAELDTDQIASPVSELDVPVVAAPVELCGQGAPPKYEEVRGAGSASGGHGSARQSSVQGPQTYMAYSPGAGIGRHAQ